MRSLWGKVLLILASGAFFSLCACTAAWAGQASPKKKAATGDAAEGQKLFERQCALCHGMDGKGGRGPALNRVRLIHAPDDAALKSVIADGIPPYMPEGWFFDDDDLAKLVAFVRSLSKTPSEPVPGDAGRGAAVYAKSGCSGCHILDGTGAGYGPELTGIGDRRNAAYLIKIIRKPSDGLPEDFMLVKATAATGEIVEGIRVNEDTFTIQIRDSAGRHHSLLKSELRDLQKLRGETPMPAFEEILAAGDLQDLVAYLASQRGKP